MTEVIIIDDDYQIRSLLSEVFKLAEVPVDVVANGIEAEALFNLKTYKVVITDIVMPEKDGFEIIFEVKQRWPDTDIIAISGGGRLDSRDYLNSAQNFGVAATFQKPLDRKALVAKVKELLAKT
ncbi:MAG: response regulator [Fibrobacter sp.]|nr:response regulator [Fibrobacter sp.]